MYQAPTDISMAITPDVSHKQGLLQKTALAAVGVGLLVLLVAAKGGGNNLNAA